MYHHHHIIIITLAGLYLSVVNCWKVTEYLIQEMLSRIDAQVSGRQRPGAKEPKHRQLGALSLTAGWPHDALIIVVTPDEILSQIL